MQDKEQLKKDYDFFNKKLGDLLKTSRNKVILIKNEKIIDIFDTHHEAYKVASQKFKLGTFIIQKIDDTPVHLSRIAI